MAIESSDRFEEPAATVVYIPSWAIRWATTSREICHLGPVQAKEVCESGHEVESSSLIHLGVPVIVSAEEESKAQASISQYGFNMVASDKISMDRRIKDTRPDE